MRAFIIFAACLALASADVGGYNYGATNAGIGRGAGNFVGSQDFGGNVASGNIGGGDAGGVEAELEKEFYTFSAPEGEFNDAAPLQDLSSSLKKNLRVIFIKGPENNGVSEAALNLAKSAVDSRTAIYVLTKQADLSGLADKLRSSNNQNLNKPEVHFVKYRTNEDAEHAQRAIQGQYDSLGGRSQQINGGVAPVLNFASKAAVAPSNSYIPPGAPAARQPSGTYLPSSFKV